jgi:DNA invertase Pin-like site-specific DNA recombinase
VETERRSISEQETDLRRQAAALGVAVVDVQAEEASAYAERERPVFTRVLAAVESGEADVVLCWSLDRFSRRGAGHVMGLVDKGLRLVTLDGIDTTQEHGRMQVAVMAEAARMESSRISTRVRRAKSAARDEGRWHGGRPPYGYRISGKGRSLVLVVEPAEAVTLREAARQVIAGESLYAVVGWLNESGAPTPAGAAWKAKGKGLLWSSTSLKSALSTPTLAGWLPHDGDVVRDESGAAVVAHEAILPPPDWRAVQAALAARAATAPGAVSTGGRPPSRLLSGMLHCPCGTVLTANAQGYRCAGPKGRPGDRHSAVRRSAENLVASMVLRRLGALEPGDPELEAVAVAWGRMTGQQNDHERRLRADAVDVARSEVDRVIRLVAKGIVDEDEAARTLPDLRAAVVRAEGALADLGPSSVDVTFLLDLGQSADDPELGPLGKGSAWDNLSPALRRTVARAVLERVEVAVAQQGARDMAARLSPVWRKQD